MTHTFLDNFSPLRSANFRLYIMGQAVSLIGTSMQLTGQGWVVWELSHSAAALGLIAMLSALPTLFLGPWVGAWADRFDRRRLLIGTAVSALILACALALLIQTGTARLWHICVLATLLGTVTALDQPAQNAFIGDLGGIAEVHKCFTLNAIAVQASRMFGPAMAGGLIGVLGVSSTFWLNSLSFVAVIWSLTRVESVQVYAQAASSPLREFGDGLVFMRTRPRIVELVAFSGIIILFGFASSQIFPAFVSSALQGGPQTLGLLLSAFGAGALFSSVVIVPLAQRLRRVGLVLSAVLSWSGFWYFSLSLAKTPWGAMSCLFFASFGQPVVLVSAKALIQRLSPSTMWGRLLSVQLMVSNGLQPFASLGIGFAAQALGAPMAIRANGLIILSSAALIFLLRPGLRAWEISLDGSPAPMAVPAVK